MASSASPSNPPRYSTARRSRVEGLNEITVEFDDPDPADTPALLADLRACLPEGQGADKLSALTKAIKTQK
ncbi:hypothetical protein ABGB12_01110 [Actinocorallia sp. B10E7]|uniref:hypothetical protein n=1 Tax=Actinocorallia sp. B10E7 TaxID=3153558 RepID=UPI00325E836F